jgi:hypothetical protein
VLKAKLAATAVAIASVFLYRFMSTHAARQLTPSDRKRDIGFLNYKI